MDVYDLRRSLGRILSKDIVSEVSTLWGRIRVKRKEAIPPLIFVEGKGEDAGWGLYVDLGLLSPELLLKVNDELFSESNNVGRGLSFLTRSLFADSKRRIVSSEKERLGWVPGCERFVTSVIGDDGSVKEDNLFIEEVRCGDVFKVFEANGDPIFDSDGSSKFVAIAEPLYWIGIDGPKWSVRCCAIETGSRVTIEGKSVIDEKDKD